MVKMEGYVTPKGLEFTVITKKWGEQQAFLTDNKWGEVKVGDVGVFDSFFGLVKVIKTFDSEHTQKGWFIAEQL